MKITDKLFSSFVVNVSKLTGDEVNNLLLYAESKENIDQWNIELCQTVVSGHCLDKDTGLFYLYLIKKNLENKVEIIRG